MRPLEPDVIVRQLETLSTDLLNLLNLLDEQIENLLSQSQWMHVDKVYLIGSGDSYHAACSAEMAFESIAKVTCEPLSSHRFLNYGVELITSRQAIVVGISASGTTKTVMQAIERAKQCGALTIAITGVADSSVTRIAERTILVELPNKEPSPGIRTYQASLMGLLLMSIQLGKMKRTVSPREATGLHEEILSLASVIDTSNDLNRSICPALFELIQELTPLLMLGGGPNYGTALYGAAKMVETAGILCLGQELEEWWHVERFASPSNMPIFIIVPPGKSHLRASELVTEARRMGRKIIAVVHKDDINIARHAHVVFPIQEAVREEFSPLLYHLFASCAAYYLAKQFGRKLFQSECHESPNIQNKVNQGRAVK